MIKLVAVSVSAMVLLASCASQPNVYYTLTAPAQLTEPGTQAASAPGPYTITTVSVPAPVDDTLLVVRQSGDQVMKLAHDRWTAPLGKQISNALAVALTRELGMPPLSRSQAARDAGPVTTLSVDVQRFDLLPGQYAELSVVWQLTPASNMVKPPSVACYTTVRESVEPGVAPLVKAQQANILKLAKAISQGWQTGQPGSDTRCQ